MRYQGSVYRPPSEAYSLIVQVTLGCAHNNCTFCSMFRDKQFQVRPMEEVYQDFQWSRNRYKHVDKIFLADGDAMVLSNSKLVPLLKYIKELFPECKRVGIYATPQDVLQKTPAELEELRDAGIGIAYLGVESGSAKVLKDVKKGATPAQMIEAGRKLEDAGIPASVTLISGLGGVDDWREHAIETGKVISAMEPSYVGLLTLMVEPAAPLYQDVKSGKFKLLTPEQVLAETYEMLKHMNVTKPCVFRSNHASNYISLKGNLPADREKMMMQLQRAMENTSVLKDERFRML